MFKSIRFKNAYFHTDDQNQRKWKSIKIDARATQIFISMKAIRYSLNVSAYFHF